MRHTVISAVATLQSRKKHSEDPIKAAEVKADSHHPDAVFTLGFVEALNSWVKSQRAYEVGRIKYLSTDQEAFLVGDVNPKRYGCVLPPSSATMPDISMFDFEKTDKLTEVDLDIIQKCMDILRHSYHPWSAQFSSTPNQHHIGIAISTLQLHKDRQYYENYLGEDIIWSLFYKILVLLQKISPSFQPWHGISSAETRVSNPIQIILQQSLHQKVIVPLVGATMAQQTAAINERYRVGLERVRKTVQDMAVYVHDGREYISYDVNDKLKGLYQVCDSAISTNFVNIA